MIRDEVNMKFKQYEMEVIYGSQKSYILTETTLLDYIVRELSSPRVDQTGQLVSWLSAILFVCKLTSNLYARLKI